MRNDVRSAVVGVREVVRFLVGKTFRGGIELEGTASQTITDVGQMAEISRDTALC